MEPDDAAGAAVRRAARVLRERIESNILFGWSVPLTRASWRPRKEPPQPSAAAPSRPAARPPGASPNVPASPALPPALVSPERAAREALLDPIRAEVEACTRCALCHGRTRTVFGVGDPTSRLLFVGEAPGFDEDRLGEPFVGKAGQLLNDIIRAMGLRRTDVYIANVVKCRPPQNRVPNPAEVGSCLGYLDRQIDIVAPHLIVALGSVSAKALLATEASIGRLRGRFHDYRGIPVLPTYHPAYLLRNPEEKKKVWEDMQAVMARLGLRRPGPSQP